MRWCLWAGLPGAASSGTFCSTLCIEALKAKRPLPPSHVLGPTCLVLHIVGNRVGDEVLGLRVHLRAGEQMGG